MDELDHFCGSEFWNSNVTWYTENPDFTPCFQKTVLVWFPCIFLWLNSLFEIFYIKYSINRYIPYGFLNVAKLLLTCILIFLSMVDIVAVIINSDSRQMYPVDYYTPIIKMATFTLSAILLDFNRRYGLRSSGSQFLFWLIILICGMPELRTQIYAKNERKIYGIDDKYDEYTFTSFIIFYIVSFALWILNFYADKEPMKTKYPKSKKMCPELGASFLSRILFIWFNPFIWKGYKKPLEQNDLWDLNPEDSSKEIMPTFSKYCERKATTPATSHGHKQKISMLTAIFKTFGSSFVFAFVMEFIRIFLTLCPPHLLRLIINFIDSASSESSSTETNAIDPLWRGILYAVLLLVFACFGTLITTQNFKRMSLIEYRARTALIGTIYKKTLRLSNVARKDASMGEIVNLMVVDTEHVMCFLNYFHCLWSTPIQIVLALYFLWDLLGPSVLAGLAVMLILIPLNGFIVNRIEKMQTQQMNTKDERIKLMSEILNGIKLLKLYAWEPSFVKQVLKIRDKEIKILKKSAYLNAAQSFFWSCTPFLVALVSFSTFVLSSSENILDAETAFVSISFFNILGFSFTLFPIMITVFIQAKVSLNRINRFMNSDELDPENVSHDSAYETPLLIENGTFTWGDGGPILRKINLKVEKNKLVAIVGSIGAGKSAIISAFLGEMEKISGRVNTFGTIAYVSQQAWIQNATLQNNILFGKPMDRVRYNEVIASCALLPDLEIFPGGDATEIGEKGINLSGGQKQRIALARAVYNDADIYLLDDPLSAVDAHVGKHIFENVIGPNGILATKTRLLVTHGITYLPNVDNIYVIKNGEISESGNLQELKFADFLKEHLQADVIDYDEIEPHLKTESRFNVELVEKFERTISFRRRSTRKRKSFIKTPVENERSEKLIEEETSKVGSVNWNVYKEYLKYVGSRLIVFTIILNVVNKGFLIASNMWLSEWSTDSRVANDTGLRNMYLEVYGAFGLGQAISTVLAMLLPYLGSLCTAIKLHMALLHGITHAPLLFFDQTPCGRILTRFSHDIDVIDTTLPDLLIKCLLFFFEVLSTIVVISFSTPIFMTVIIPLGAIYYLIQTFYIPTSRQLKRLESVSLSPIYSHFNESIQGATTIRAFNATNRFIIESEQKVDNNQSFNIPLLIADLWMGLRLEMIGNFIIFFAALFAVLGRDTLDAGTVGFSVSYALQITMSLKFLIKMACEIETNMVSVERVKEYAETKQEIESNHSNGNFRENWPENGKIQFKNLNVRYRADLDLVLRNLSFTVNEREKVGIVGRTGAGKSSLTLALFRIIEAAGGSIVIDGEDISKLGLQTLRSKLTIIPQDPVLFSGSLRINLDPFDEKTDAEIWIALELAHLKSFVMALKDGLSHEVTEGGGNLSVGQRQLICLARALLRKTKVLILDEATAAVDLQTDDLIQKTIRTEFKECTILTIAHRLNTIMDSDKIIVLDKGHVIEFDVPSVLLQNKNSVFYSMAKDAGLI